MVACGMVANDDKRLECIAIDFLVSKTRYLPLLLNEMDALMFQFRSEPELLTKILARGWITWLLVLKTRLRKYISSRRTTKYFPYKLMVAGFDFAKAKPTPSFRDEVRKLYYIMVDLETISWLDQLKAREDCADWRNDLVAHYFKPESRSKAFHQVRKLR